MTSPVDDDGTLAATEYAATEQRVSLPVMFFRGADEARYERERVLGEGGMGIVELHRDKRIGRSVAVKLLRAELVDSTSQRRFLHEAQLQGQLEHPAIDVHVRLAPARVDPGFAQAQHGSGGSSKVEADRSGEASVIAAAPSRRP